MKKKNNTLKYVLIGLGVVLILVIAGSKLGWFGKGDVTQVATDKSEKRSIKETVSASGKIQPEVEVKLSSEVSGEIVELSVKEGDVVKKGQLLCKVRPDILQSGYNRAVASLNSQKASLAGTEQQLKQAQANFKNTEAVFKRSSELYKQKVLSASEYDAAEAQYTSAKANLEALRQNVIGSRYGIDQSSAMVKEAGDNLAKATIFAPVDGVISKLSVELGERVVGTAQMAGTEIMRISNLNTMEASVDVNESDINRVSLNNEAEIEIDAFQGKKFKGVVTEIGSSANVAGTSADQVTNFTVKVRMLPESYAALIKSGNANTSPFRPGLSATVDIQTNKVTGIAIPIQAVTTREEDKPKGDAGKGPQSGNNNNSSQQNEKKSDEPVKEYVFVYSAGKVKQVLVTTGIQDDTYIQVLSGLKGGEEVVSRPFNAISRTLKDGMAVEKVSKEKLFTPEKK
ncbi:efflux RND transporter periplasmic adaptor subunit [Hufsiella ginkgonis]|uniref:Efflux RND transporter periplasmic adaptor subunit n=1 Tax=Hufsiella ginkgonis TaxID=2695274 RepID=A0A7K1Y1J1_9SPHI|nr:efflux RND transporter periplasmic adaptor subunit [Hufsiella ginkgonis]MXV17115.1 efflux RND transporter periplasmic adaptor subunit [Hufsiella ginkgonis]